MKKVFRIILLVLAAIAAPVSLLRAYYHIQSIVIYLINFAPADVAELLLLQIVGAIVAIFALLFSVIYIVIYVKGYLNVSDEEEAQALKEKRISNLQDRMRAMQQELDSLTDNELEEKSE